MANWPANGDLNWNAAMLTYLAVEHNTNGTHKDISFDNLVVDNIKTKSPWVDVTHPDFGAIGDGTTDDLTAFQNAANVAAGGILFIPEPSVKWKVTEGVNLSSDTTVIGGGYGSHCYIDSTTNHEYFFMAASKSNIHIEKLRFSTSKVTGLGAIKFDTCTNVSTSMIWADAISTGTIEFDDCDGWQARNTFLGTDFVAGIIGGATSGSLLNGVIDGFWSEGGSLYYPIDIELSGDGVAIDNVSISNYYIKDPPFPGIAVQLASNVYIGNGTITGCSHATRGGIYLRVAKDTIINGAQVYDGAFYGIHFINACDRASLSNVRTSGNNNGGVLIDSTGAYNTHIVIDDSCIMTEAVRVYNSHFNQVIGMIDKSNPISPRVMTANTDWGVGSTIQCQNSTLNVTGVTINADDWITLPPAVQGSTVIVLCNAGSNFEIRTRNATNETINGLDSDGTNEYLATDTDMIIFTAHLSTGWIGRSYQADSTLRVVTPD